MARITARLVLVESLLFVPGCRQISPSACKARPPQMTRRDRSDDSCLLLSSMGLLAGAFAQIAKAPSRLLILVDVVQPKLQRVAVVASIASQQLIRLDQC